MSKDLINAMRKKIKWLTAAVVILAILLVAVAVFAFSDFEMIFETVDDYEIQQDNGEINGNAQIEQQANVNENNDTVMICGTIILCVLIVTIGVVVYAHSRKKAQDGKNNAESWKRNDEQK